jgi:hypothetical protein
MFPRTSQTDRCFIDCEGPDDDALRTAFIWLTDEAKRRSVQAVVVTYAKANAENFSQVLGQQVSAALVAGKTVTVNGQAVKLATVTKGLPASLRGSVVLAVWIDDRKLSAIDDLAPQAMCVIPWIPDGIRQWLTSWQPRDLRSGQAKASRNLGPSPIVQAALSSLTVSVNLSTGLAHPDDRDEAILTFRLLRERNEPFEAAEVRAWAVNNGWSAKGADEMCAVAQAVLDGRKLQVKGQTRRWGKDVFDYWVEQAQEAQEHK